MTDYTFRDQPIITDHMGVERFAANSIVRYLLDAGPFDMNHLATRDFDAAAEAQFAQLIGYSVAGYGELSYVSDALYERAVNYNDEQAQTAVAAAGFDAGFAAGFAKAIEVLQGYRNVRAMK